MSLFGLPWQLTKFVLDQLPFGWRDRRTERYVWAANQRSIDNDHRITGVALREQRLRSEVDALHDAVGRTIAVPRGGRLVEVPVLQLQPSDLVNLLLMAEDPLHRLGVEIEDRTADLPEISTPPTPTPTKISSRRSLPQPDPTLTTT